MQTDIPLVSILIPSFNHRRYVTQTLQSILEDDYPRKEVIVVDDGSTDGSDEAIRAWIAEHPQLPVSYTHRPNRGLPATLNELLSQSSGDFVVLLASDDMLLPGGIAARVAYLRSHPQHDAVFADCTVVDGEGRQIASSGLFEYRKNRRDYFRDADSIRCAFIRRFTMPGPVLMTRRSYYDTNRYDESFIMEDFDFYLKIAAEGKIGFLDCKVSAYRIHESNVSGGGDRTRYLRLMRDGRKILWRRRSLFDWRCQPLIWWQLTKLSIRIALYRYGIAIGT